MLWTQQYSSISPPHGTDIHISWLNKSTPSSLRVWKSIQKEHYGSLKKKDKHNLYLGENLEILGELLHTHRASFDLIYADPPFDSVASYKKSVHPIGDKNFRFYEEQYNDSWEEGTYAQFLFIRFLIFRDLLKENGSIYVHCDWHSAPLIRMILDEVFGKKNFLNEIIWHHDFGGRGNRFLARKHDNIFLYKKGRSWYFDNSTLPLLPYQGNLHKYRGNPKKGKKPTAVWHDIQPKEETESVWDIAYENKMSHKNTGYPTQKPQTLLERLIHLSCPIGGMILDPFVGSGTTLRAADNLGRVCYGIDSNKDAIETTRNHLLLQNPETNIDIHSLHQCTNFRSERNAQLKLCKTHGFIFITPGMAKKGDNTIILIAPLCRPCFLSDLRSIWDAYQNTKEREIKIKIILWAHSYVGCDPLIEEIGTERQLTIQSIQKKIPFSVSWRVEDQYLIIEDISFPLLRKKLQTPDILPWTQLVTSIRFQHQGPTPDKILIATSKIPIPKKYNLNEFEGLESFSITDILSRTTTLSLPTSY